MIEGLLEEKYGRPFDLVLATRGFDSAPEPLAYCCERGVDDLVFEAKFDVSAERIVWDQFVKRRLGRQVEDVISECFGRQGLGCAPMAHVSTLGSDPDITLDEFIAKGDELDGYSVEIVISDKVGNPEASPQMHKALTDVYERLKSANIFLIMVVEEQDLATYQDYLRLAPRFNSAGRPEWGIIGGYKARLSDGEVTVYVDDFYQRFGYTIR
jgi:hypothetical protein